MASVEQNVKVYQDLAYAYVQQGQPQMRDRFLVLAVDAMHTAGRADEAEKLRQRLLQVNPHHLFKPFRSVADAMKTPDVKNYVEGLRRTYPPDKAAQLLESLRSGKGDAPAPEAPAANKDNMGLVTIPGPAPEQLKIFGLEPDKRSGSNAVTGAPTKVRGSNARFADPGSPPGWRASLGEMDGPEEFPGAWVAAGLFWITLAAAVALFVYTLGGPFLPF